MNKKQKIFTALAVLVFFTNVQAKAENEQPMTLREAAVFYANVARQVITYYVDSINIEKLLEGALRGMLTSVDQHSDYLSSQQYEELRGQTEGKYGGLGIEVTMDEGVLRIISPIDDTPAFKAGLKPGDIITKIDDKLSFGMSMRDLVESLKGEPSTKVKVTILRKDDPGFDVTIERAVIDIDPVKSFVKDNIIYIRISTFNQRTTDEVRNAIEKHLNALEQKARGIIIDVRNNPGGLLNQAVTASNLFLPEGNLIVSIRGKMKDGSMRFESQGGDITCGLPLAIMINAASASASEIMAGAIKCNKRGLVVGEKSFGKGSVQTVMPLTNGGAIRLTTAHYHTPDGASIQEKGIEPNIVIPTRKNAKSQKDDYQLEQTLAIVKGIHVQSQLN